MRLLVSAVVAAAAFAAPAAPASAECVGGNFGVCYQLGECSRICRYHVVVDGYCYDSPDAICSVFSPIHVDSDRLSR